MWDKVWDNFELPSFFILSKFFFSFSSQRWAQWASIKKQASHIFTRQIFQLKPVQQNQPGLAQTLLSCHSDMILLYEACTQIMFIWLKFTTMHCKTITRGKACFCHSVWFTVLSFPLKTESQHTGGKMFAVTKPVCSVCCLLFLTWAQY